MRRALAIAATASIVLIATHGIWLPWVADFLVQAEQPQPADAILVLAGDGYGDRILMAAELARRGIAPKVYVSGPEFFYGSDEANLAIDFAHNRGYTDVQFVPMVYDLHSTADEARLLLPVIARAGVHRLLVVTSDFHSRRAGKILRQDSAGISLRMVAAPYRNFHADSWWKHREDRKTVLLEWTKTLTEPFGI